MLEVNGCRPAIAPDVRRALTVEIGDLLRAPDSLDHAASHGDNGDNGDNDNDNDNDHLVITCDRSLARLQSRGTRQRLPLERTMDLADFPGDATPRALALAGLELLASFSPEVRRRVDAGGLGPAIATRVRAPAPGTNVRKPWSRIAIGGCARTFLASNGATAWGGRVEVEREIGDRYEVALGAEVSAASRDVGGLGQVTGTLGSMAAMGGARVGGRDLTGTLSIGARLGLARLEGHPAMATSVAGARVLRRWGGPLVAAGVRAGFGHVDVQLAAEAGLDPGVSRGVADGTTVLAVGGPWLSLFAGAGIRF